MSVRATNHVRSLRGLSPVEKAVAFVFADHDSHYGKGSFPGMQTVAEESGLNDRETASRVTKRLVAKGVIVPDQMSKGGRGVTTVYRFPINCDSPITVLDGETVTPEEITVTAKTETVTLEPLNCDSPVTRRGEGENRRTQEKGKDSLILSPISKSKPETLPEEPPRLPGGPHADDIAHWRWAILRDPESTRDDLIYADDWLTEWGATEAQITQWAIGGPHAALRLAGRLQGCGA